MSPSNGMTDTFSQSWCLSPTRIAFAARWTTVGGPGPRYYNRRNRLLGGIPQKGNSRCSTQASTHTGGKRDKILPEMHRGSVDSQRGVTPCVSLSLQLQHPTLHKQLGISWNNFSQLCWQLLFRPSDRTRRAIPPRSQKCHLYTARPPFEEKRAKEVLGISLRTGLGDGSINSLCRGNVVRNDMQGIVRSRWSKE